MTKIATCNQDGTLTFEGRSFKYIPGQWVAGTFRQSPTRVTPGGSYPSYLIAHRDELVVTIPATTPSLWARLTGTKAKPETTERWTLLKEKES